MVALRIRLLAVTRFRLLGCTSVVLQTTLPFLFAAPFNISEMVGGCFLVGVTLVRPLRSFLGAKIIQIRYTCIVLM